MNNCVWLETSGFSFGNRNPGAVGGQAGLSRDPGEQDQAPGCTCLLWSGIPGAGDVMGQSGITGAVPGALQGLAGGTRTCSPSVTAALCLLCASGSGSWCSRASFELGERSQDSKKSLVWAVVPGE